VEKILAERLNGRDPDFAQSCVDLGQLHSGENEDSAVRQKSLCLFTKKCEQNAP
jgi:hypothetical protein